MDGLLLRMFLAVEGCCRVGRRLLSCSSLLPTLQYLHFQPILGALMKEGSVISINQAGKQPSYDLAAAHPRLAGRPF